MSRETVTNVAASTLAKLGNLAKSTGRRHQDVVQTYALERWLALHADLHADRMQTACRPSMQDRGQAQIGA